MDKVWKIVRKLRYETTPVESSGVSLLIKITSQCRSRCRYCLSWQSQPVQLSLCNIEDIVENVKQFAGSRVVLSGGEPTVHPLLSKILKLFANTDIPISMITDGLYSAGIDWVTMLGEIIFSIDTLDSENYYYTRGVNGSKKAFDNMSKAIRSGTRTSVNIVLTNRAIHSIENTICRLADAGIHCVNFLELETHLGIAKELWLSKDDLLLFQQELLPKLKQSYPNIIPNYHQSEKYRSTNAVSTSNACLIPWMHMTIRPNGSVYPCCRLGDDTTSDSRNDLYCLGNINQDTICGIWDSLKRRKVQSLIRTNPLLTCLKCNIGSLFQCGEDVWEKIETIRM